MEVCKLKVLGSSSSGNSYILDVGNEILLIECGVDKKTMLRGLNYDLSRISACVSTHKHKDHVNPQTLKYLLDCGIKVYSNADVASIYPKVKVIEPMKRVQIGGFKVMALEVPHGDCPNYAYVIDTPDNQRILFCTDAQTLPYRLPNVNVLMIEANYSEELIIDRLCEGQDIRSHYNAHMELNETIKVIKRLNNPNMNKIILIHLSANNSDEQIFKDRIFSETGVRCEIAHSGDVFELKICEF